MPIIGLNLLALTMMVAATDAPSTHGDGQGSLDYAMELSTIFAPSKEGSWFQPRPVAIPAEDGANPTIVMTIQRALGSDFSTGLAVSRSEDFGHTWSPPAELPELAWREAEEGLKVGVCVLRHTERIAVPERGKALGNFDATTANAEETWITVAGGEAFCARIVWNRPNKLAGRVN